MGAAKESTRDRYEMIIASYGCIIAVLANNGDDNNGFNWSNDDNDGGNNNKINKDNSNN